VWIRRLLLESIDLARAIIDLIEEVKGEDIVLIDLREVTLIADYFVICTGTSDRQINALTERIRTDIKRNHGVLPLHVEGEGSTGWVLMDYGAVVVHLFLEDRRHYYDLEGLWRKAKILLRIQ
jgi:ribosome-associated protein